MSPRLAGEAQLLRDGRQIVGRHHRAHDERHVNHPAATYLDFRERLVGRRCVAAAEDEDAIDRPLPSLAGADVAVVDPHPLELFVDACPVLHDRVDERGAAGAEDDADKRPLGLFALDKGRRLRPGLLAGRPSGLARVPGCPPPRNTAGDRQQQCCQGERAAQPIAPRRLLGADAGSFLVGASSAPSSERISSLGGDRRPASRPGWSRAGSPSSNRVSAFGGAPPDRPAAASSRACNRRPRGAASARGAAAATASRSSATAPPRSLPAFDSDRPGTFLSFAQ